MSRRPCMCSYGLLPCPSPVASPCSLGGKLFLANGAELLHLLGVTLWVGGLGYFATLFWWSTFREESAAGELAWAIPAFSLLAVGAVGVLTISGLYLAQLYLDSPDQLLATS